MALDATNRSHAPGRSRTGADHRRRGVLAIHCENLPRETPYSVVEAVNGEEGLRLAKAHAPSLILLDLVMTDLNGKEVLRRLKGTP